MDPIRIEVGSRRGPYSVLIGVGLTKQLGALLAEAGLSSQRVPVSAVPIWKLHGAAITQACGDDEPILLPDGERHKTLATVSRIYDALLRMGVDRSGGIVALGGGVIGDVAGFAAATYLRGLTLAHVPTTLLAQVDSAIGGKVGVNHPLGKNLIGAFHAPAIVVVDPLLLVTLARREFRAGLYEVAKYGVIANRDLFDRLRAGLPAIFAREPAVLLPVIADSCRIKAAIVTADEHERDERRVLNFGHTAGHALEALTRYRRFRHGEAVAYGMLIAAEVAVARGALGDEARQRLAQLLMQMGPLPPLADLSTREAIGIVRRDKKVVAGQLHFVLPTGIGSTETVDDVTEQELARAMRRVGMRP